MDILMKILRVVLSPEGLISTAIALGVVMGAERARKESYQSWRKFCDWCEEDDKKSDRDF